MVSIPPNPGLAFAPRVGVGEGSRSRGVGASPLGVRLSAAVMGVEARAKREGVVVLVSVAILVGDGFGVDCRRGEGEAGLSGLRNGDARGEP